MCECQMKLRNCYQIAVAHSVSPTQISHHLCGCLGSIAVVFLNYAYVNLNIFDVQRLRHRFGREQITMRIRYRRTHLHSQAFVLSITEWSN
jgi:hypothetical protein